MVEEKLYVDDRMKNSDLSIHDRHVKRMPGHGKQLFHPSTLQFSIILALFFISLHLTAQERPNIVLIVADDLGYGDMSCYGSEDIHTPNLDQLAAEGVRFTDFYANAPECTPTRTALLTGRYQQRVGGLECAIGLGNVGRYTESKALSDQGKLGLPPRFNVLPGSLKEQGYQSALIGKWHLGEGKDYQPVAHGFDYSIGPLGGAVDYFHHTEPVGEFLGTDMKGNHDLYRNGIEHWRDGYYMNHLITDEAVEWLNIQDKNRPFFLYIPYTTPHHPHQGPDDYEPEKMTMKDWNSARKESYVAMIEDMDEGVGKILKKLEKEGIADNTVVLFFSDNGPGKTGSAGPFSGHKGQVFEGGIRVPCIIRWPARINPGTVSSQACISMDLTASIVAVTHSKPHFQLDGIDIIQHLQSGNDDFDRNLFWRKKRGETVFAAVRSGHLKYIRNQDGNKIEEFLFDLKKDPGEKNDLITKNERDFHRLKNLLINWEKDVQPERYN